MSQATVDRFAQGIELVESVGVFVRFEYLHGSGGGLCQLKQQSHLFVDLALDINDQLENLEQALGLLVSEDWKGLDSAGINQWLNRA